ncbi:H-NS histone family protein [Burkholderia sp. Ac-20384]|uniref:H-NS histone family protein n=1 Tax=Burkholderia sp. Ac-20384 TaxID=2703902 RepID=UPI00198165CB|nr:H-NS histone family protein [Burkholderia sp. Ac-20384]MBN3827503.1 H-NS histone family protein [Burkholderia sp. Ac-20384]
MPQLLGGEYFDLIRQRDVLQEKIDRARQVSLNDVLIEISRVMVAYDISLGDLEKVFSRFERRPNGRRVAPKYIDPRTGKTWSGRGRRPVWLNGKDPEDFRLEKASVSDRE